MSIINNNNALNKILSMINDLPNIDDVGGSIVYTNIVYNDDNTITLTDKDGVDHTMVCEYTEGVLSSLTYDGKAIELTYEEDTLVGVGATEVDMENAPCEESGGYGQGETLPTKGFVVTEWNSEGFATKGELYGMTTVPNGFFMCNNNTSESSFFRSLLSVIFTEDIVSFGANAFMNQKNLLMTKIPATLQSIGVNCFKNCSKIAFETIPDAVSTIDNCTFQNCSELKVSKLPSSITNIGNYAFSGCKKVNVSEIPEGVTNIGVQAFDNCGLTTITFKGTPVSIATNSFQNCDNLTDIYVPWAEGEVENAPFGATSATIHYNTQYDENGNPIVSEV